MLKVLYSKHNNTLTQTSRATNDHCPGAPERGAGTGPRKTLEDLSASIGMITFYS